MTGALVVRLAGPEPDSHMEKTRSRAIARHMLGELVCGYFIEQLQKEREDFAAERKEYFERIVTTTHRIGELVTRLLQLDRPLHPEDERAV